MSIPGPKEIKSANLYHTYMLGWKSGAASKSFITASRDPELQEAYTAGYSDGQIARHEAIVSAQSRYEFKPSILRGTHYVQDDGGE
jgi:hypothetical protein